MGHVVSALPWGPEDEKTPAGIETIIAAETVRPARGKVLEEVYVKREAGGVRQVILECIRDEEVQEPVVVEVKEEPAD